jgi:hypothetical protein
MSGEKEIEITPQMIKAGLRVLEISGRLTTDYLKPSDKILVQELFLVMWHSRIDETPQ